jgi:hypothetical protein
MKWGKFPCEQVPIRDTEDKDMIQPVVTTILQQRGATHGDFAENARLACGMRDLLRNSPGWQGLNDRQRLALDELALKIARLMSVPGGNYQQPANTPLGNPSQNPEHWRDIQGYAKLGEDACSKTS